MVDGALVPSTLTAAEAAAIRMVLDGLPSEHSRRAYERALVDFFRWHRSVGRPALNKALVQRYAAELRDIGLSSSSINQRLSAIRKLAAEAADNGALDQQIAGGIRAVKGARQEGRRTGNWLTREQAQHWSTSPCIVRRQSRRRSGFGWSPLVFSSGWTTCEKWCYIVVSRAA